MNAEQTQSEIQPQVDHRLLRLTAQLEQMQVQLDHLVAEVRSSGSQVDVLTRHMTTPQGTDTTGERISEVASRLEETTEQLSTLSQSIAGTASREQLNALTETLNQRLAGMPRQSQINALQEALQKKLDQVASQTQVENLNQAMARLADQTQLEQLSQSIAEVANREQLEQLTNMIASQKDVAELGKNVKRLNRTQFKSNALSENREQQITDSLTILQGIATRREELHDEQKSQYQQHLEETRSQARGELVAEFLPAMDSLEMALASGHTLLAKQPQVDFSDEPSARIESQPSPGLIQRLLQAWANQPQPVRVIREPARPNHEMSNALAGWLQGLELVRDRILGLLSQEGIEPIPALDGSFDPQLHVAVEAENRDDVAPNTVVRVLRNGYRQQDRILRYAEVVVARAREN